MENIRRRHNYLPLIMGMLKILAKRGQLVPLCEEVRKGERERERYMYNTYMSLPTPGKKEEIFEGGRK